MRRWGRPARSLSGQILFVEAVGGSVTVDCVLGDERNAGPIMCTLSFRLPERVTDPVLDVLTGWELRQVSVKVIMEDGPQGAQVEISADDGRLVLQPCD